MALVNTSTTSLLGLLLLTFGLAGTMSAPVSQDWDVDAASGDTNENAIELKNGLLVLVQITVSDDCNNIIILCNFYIVL